MEFEDDLSFRAEVEEAVAQLKRYAKELFDKERRRTWALASDGLRFKLYRVKYTDTGEVELEIVYELNIDEDEDPVKFYWFIYEYFFEERFVLPLTSEGFTLRFGFGSRAFQDTMELLKRTWKEIKQRGKVAEVMFEEWVKHYTYVTGEERRDEELFLRHTYLAILAKILAFITIEHDGPTLFDTDRLHEALSGYYFSKLGINIFENDYFTWFLLVDDARKEFLKKLVEVLIKEIMSFDFSSINTDVFKEIYQNIVEREERASLGEYYTPDFITEYMLGELLKEDPAYKILDPACGSGTFLFTAIKIKKEKLRTKFTSKEDLVKHITESVVGIDVNPIAVIISRANYLVALRDLLPIKGTIRIPVYLANSVVVPEKEREKLVTIQRDVIKIPGYRENEYFYLPDPKEIGEISLNDIDEFLEIIRDVAKTAKSEEDLVRKIESRLKERFKDELSYLVEIAKHNSKLLRRYIEEGRDTFWIFVLRNQYVVFLLKNKFDAVVGNPPWVSRTDVSSPRFREWFDRVFKYYQEKHTIKLPQELRGAPADTAMLFILHSIEYYLKEGGYLYFVLPHSFLVGKQYSDLRSEEIFSILKITDLSEMQINIQGRGKVPIFNVPCILLLARKERKQGPSEIKGHIVTGTVTYRSRNVPLSVVNHAIKERSLHSGDGVYVKSVENKLVFKRPQEEEQLIKKLMDTVRDGRLRSPYYDVAVAGISAYPRILVFVKIPKQYALSPDKIYVETHPRALEREKGEESKKKWMQVLKGRVSYKYLYLLITGDNVFPFGVWGINIAVLPIQVDDENNRFIVLEPKEVLEELGDWYRKGIDEYCKRNDLEAKEKEKCKNHEDFISWFIEERVNYQNKVAKQRLLGYMTVYNRTGDALNLGSAVVNKKETIERANKFLLREYFQLSESSDLRAISGVLADHETYLIETNSPEEAHYTCAILQSSVVGKATRELQPKGLKGPRHITRIPFRLPIPKFINAIDVTGLEGSTLSKSIIEKMQDLQLKLAQRSMELHERVFSLLESYIYKEHGIPLINVTDKSLSPNKVGEIRRRIKNQLKHDYDEIDRYTADLLKLYLSLKKSGSKKLVDYLRGSQNY